MNDLRLDWRDLVENPTPRVPICLVLDTSGSLQGQPIEELNRGVRTFFDAVKNDEIASYSAEISIVTFGGDVNHILDFANIDQQLVPELNATGNTPLGQAVNMALDLLESRKAKYAAAGVDYYQPWMILMTDGTPTDHITSAVERTRELVEDKKLTIFPIGIGRFADLATLNQFSPRRKAVRIKGLNFIKFFEWLSKSISHVSRSMPGEKVTLPPINGWHEL